MAKTNGPLLSINAYGSVGKINTYSHRKTGNQCRYQRRQKDSKSDAQLRNREYIFLLHFLWTQLSAAQKATFSQFVPDQNLPNYNAFIKCNLIRLYNSQRLLKAFPNTFFDEWFTLPTIQLPYTPSISNITQNYYTIIGRSSPQNDMTARRKSTKRRETKTKTKDRKSTRLISSHSAKSRMPSSA